MGNPRHLWVRDVVSYGNDVGDPDGFKCDLLWKARTGSNIQGSDVTPPSFAGDELYPQDISGALVKRVFVQIQLIFAPIPLPPAPGSSGTRINRAGCYVGLGVFPAESTGYGTYLSNPQVGDEARSVILDWMYWRRHYIYESDDLVETAVEAGSQATVIKSIPIDCKAQRRLNEWDSTLRLLIEPSVEETIDDFALSWSVLLEQAA